MNKAIKLEFGESNLIMERILSSLSLSPCVCVCWLEFLPFAFSLTFNLSLSLPLSLLNSFVDAALQRLLCGVMSSSITLFSGPFNQVKLTKQ